MTPAAQQGEVVGNIRASVQAFIDAENEIRELWEAEEHMMSPTDVKEVLTLIQTLEESIDRTLVTMEHFKKVAEVRKVSKK